MAKRQAERFHSQHGHNSAEEISYYTTTSKEGVTYTINTEVSFLAGSRNETKECSESSPTLVMLSEASMLDSSLSLGMASSLLSC
jgi:hypothetical protein